MESIEYHGDIAAHCQSCIAAFKELMQYRLAESELQAASIAELDQHANTTYTTIPRNQSTQCIQGSLSLADVETAFSRFKIWAGNLGALQRGSGSLDVRLRDSSVIRDAILRILNSLRETLSESIEVVSGRRLPFEKQGHLFDIDDDSMNEHSADEDDSESDDEITELAMRAQSLKSHLADLHRLSFKIRSSASRGPNSRALTFMQCDRESGIDVFSIYEQLDRQHIYEHLASIRRKDVTELDITDTGEPHRKESGRWSGLDDKLVDTPVKNPLEISSDVSQDFLANRLALANTNRRRRFAYWRRHALKLSVDHNVASELRAPDGSVATPSEGLLPVTTQDGPTPLNQTTPSLLSGTIATKLDPGIEDRLDAETIISYGTTAYGPEGDAVTLPPPPPIAAEQSEFLCQICHVLCPSKQGKKKEWRTHVLHDLHPYICTYSECSTAGTLYPTRSSWLEHERLMHRRVWQCHEHLACIFTSMGALQNHLIAIHKDLTEKHAHQLASFAEAAVADNRTECPFCLDMGPFSKGFNNHMAFHQEQIATFSLPRGIYDSDDGASQLTEAQGNQSRSSLSSIMLDQDTGFAPTFHPAVIQGVEGAALETTKEAVKSSDSADRWDSARPKKETIEQGSESEAHNNKYSDARRGGAYQQKDAQLLSPSRPASHDASPHRHRTSTAPSSRTVIEELDSTELRPSISRRRTPVAEVNLSWWERAKSLFQTTGQTNAMVAKRVRIKRPDATNSDLFENDQRSPFTLEVTVWPCPNSDVEERQMGICVLDTGCLQGNIISMDFTNRLGYSTFLPLERGEESGATVVTGSFHPVIGAVNITWYHSTSPKVFRNMRFLVSETVPVDLVIGTHSIVKNGLVAPPH